VKQILSCLILLSCFNCHVFAQGGNEYIPLLEEVIVVEKHQPELGESLIGGSQLEMLPSRSGSITEALKVMSNIQYDYATDSSMTLGEITPPRISIAGAKPYENNYLIDEMSITNTLNPSGFVAGYSKPNYLTVGGGDQMIFYNTHLIDSITVFDSNVPAKYGAFVGGVVRADLRDPRSDRWHYQIEGRHTRDTFFDMDDDINSDSEVSTEQPKFTIYNSSITADGPITDNLSALLFVSQQYSIIPLKRKLPDGSFEDDDQERTNYNFFIRMFYEPAPSLSVKFDATYAPYDAHYWRNDWIDSDWYIKNDSWRFTTQGEYRSDIGEVNAKISYALNGYSRESKSNYSYYESDRSTGSAQYTRSGGNGDAETNNKEIGANLSFISAPFKFSSSILNYEVGIEVNYKNTDTWNQETTVDTMLIRSAPYNENVSDYYTKNTISEYFEVSQTDHVTNYSFYLQGELAFKSLTINPGFRVDYDDFAKNIDVAPRFKTEYDVFDNGSVRIVGGLNRYYGSSLRGYAFDRFRPYYNTKIELDIPGGTPILPNPYYGTDINYSTDGIDTPFSDEVTGGIAGTIAGFDYGVNLVFRDHKKQIISETNDGDNYYLTNNGKSKYEGISISLSRAWQTLYYGDHQFTLSASKSKTETFNGSYDSDISTEPDRYGNEYLYYKVFYDGEYIDRSELPANNYNGPMVLTLSINSNYLNDRLRLNTLLRWRDSADGLIPDKRLNDDTPYGTVRGRESSSWFSDDGSYSNAYKNGIIDGGFRVDVTFEFDVIKRKEFDLTMILEIVNLTNETMETTVDEDGARTFRRGCYLGVRATF